MKVVNVKALNKGHYSIRLVDDEHFHSVVGSIFRQKGGMWFVSGWHGASGTEQIPSGTFKTLKLAEAYTRMIYS